MYRTTIQTVIALAIVALWVSGNAMAFTLHLGPIPGADAESALPVMGATDLPTPQLFRMAIGQNGVTLGTTPPSEGYMAPQPQLRYQEVSVSQAADDHATQQVSKASPIPRLSGAELLLLRKTQIVADRQSN